MKTNPFLGPVAIMTALMVMTEDVVPGERDGIHREQRSWVLRFRDWIRGLI